uniref:Retrotransposon protein, putative, Ty1-copia subclass n=1 Tax=Oryza sativa subsp. japonica TaxID=39947 RepID=Q2QUJ4_ORYSJ|nr:retrotransposon protein, putative, Ty1-copia subclass [Oryza sativa Japonica Group]
MVEQLFVWAKMGGRMGSSASANYSPMAHRGCHGRKRCRGSGADLARIDVGHLYAEIISLLDKIMAAPAPSNFNLRSILEKEKLTGINFMDWYRNLRIVLRQEHKEFVLTQPFLADLPNNARAAQRREHEMRCNEYFDISCLMLATMSPELQRQYEALDAHTIITGLCNMFEDQARAERLAEGNPVSPHMIKMIGYTESLDKLGFPLSQELATDLILQSLPPSFEPFIMNFNMNNLNKTLAELHGMLKTAKESIKKNSNHVMVMHKSKPNNKKSGQKRKLNSDEITSTSNSKTKVQKTGPAKDAECFFCKETGHWKRNFAHICKSLQGLKRSRSLARGEVDIRVGNGARVAAVATIKYLRSDRGGEYLSLEFGNHLKECGIVPQLTPPGTPQWNGVSERRNRTLLDIVRSMMSQTDLPLSFWAYALEKAAFTLNKVPSKSVNKTPYEIWTGKRPSLSFLKIWGCEVYVKRLQSDKLTPKSDKCFFVGYPKETKGYYFYNREEGKVFVARHGVFLEKEFILRKNSGSMLWKHQLHEGPKGYGVHLRENDEPTTYEEAMVGLGAMKSEIESMHVNQVWNLVDPPDGVKAIEWKWVFKKKTDVDGNVHIYKARLVAKGFRQIQGVDYDETFSLVAMLKSIQIVLAITAYFDYEIWQMDVKTAFVNGNIDEDVYMTQLKGFVDPQSAKKICKLQKSIYGLKQASRSWNIRFDEVVKAWALSKTKKSLVLYVDDILLIGNDIPMLESVKTSLKNSFSMKDLGEAAYILGIRIYRDRSKRLIGLSQSTYIDKVLKRFNMQDSKKGFLPMSHGINLGKNQCPQTTDERNKMSVIPYASAIGSIMYAMLCTHPDVSYALSATSRYQSDPGESHWIAVKNILKYLRRTKDMFLVYGGQEELVVKGYTDASFQTDKDDFRSQSGFVFCLNGGAVSWKSSKQDTVVDSITEAEYIAASEAAKEAVWIKKFVSQLGVMTSASSPMDLYCDNSGAIAQAKEPRSHQKSNILWRYHLIREIVGRGVVKICKIHTDFNVADPLTKPLPQPKHQAHTRAMGVRYIHD